jgi:hypothetical protein
VSPSSVGNASNYGIYTDARLQPSVYFTSTTTVSTTTEWYYECSATPTPTGASGGHHTDHGQHVQHRNYRDQLPDVFENNRGYHRVVSTVSGNPTTMVSAFTTSSAPPDAATTSIDLSILVGLEPSSTLEPTNSTASCISMVGTPSPAFILASVPGYTFRYDCGTTMEDVEACPWLCGDFSPQQCSAMDLANVTAPGYCHQCPVPCSNGTSPTAATISPPTPGTTFAGPTVTNATAISNSTTHTAPSRTGCYPAPANATLSPAVVLQQSLWRIQCGQTVEDVVACPYLCDYFSGCDGLLDCGRRCSSAPINGTQCQQCNLPCPANGTTSRSLSLVPFPTLAASLLSAVASSARESTANVSINGLPRFSSGPSPTCNTASETSSAAISIETLIGVHFRFECGTNVADVVQCPWLCGTLCSHADLSLYGAGPCVPCLLPCSFDPSSIGANSTNSSVLTLGPASNSTQSAAPTTTTALLNLTAPCTTIPATAAPSAARYDPVDQIFLREFCGTNAIEVEECPWLCGYYGTRGCSPLNLTGDYIDPVLGQLPCEQCLLPCSEPVPEWIVVSGTLPISATAPEPSSTCVQLPPGLRYYPNLYEPILDVSLRLYCPNSPETSVDCPWLCGYYSTKLCSSTNLTDTFTDPVLGPLPCESCPEVCPSRVTNPYYNVEGFADLPQNLTVNIIVAPSISPVCTSVEPSPSPALTDPFLTIQNRYSCGTTVDEVTSCTWLCGYPGSLRGCSPVNLTGALSPWYDPPCEQCLLPCGLSNGTAAVTATIVGSTIPGSESTGTVTPTTIVATSNDTAAATPSPTDGLRKRLTSSRRDQVTEREAQVIPNNALAGRSPVLARAVCPSPPSQHCPYLCADKDDEDCGMFCSTELYDSESSISCIECPGAATITSGRHHHRRQSEVTIGSPTPFTGRAQEIVVQMASAIFVWELFNSGINITTVCEQLDVVKNFQMGLDGTAIKELICNLAANPTAPPYTPFEQVVGPAAVLYAVQVAGGYAGGSNLKFMCNNVYFQIVTDLGFDGQAAKDFVCAEAVGVSPSPTGSATATPTSGSSSKGDYRSFTTSTHKGRN